ncbi:protein KRI1 homolog [Plutella xylostella]|uniref:protein KRI1 homolog n=1 Tax=Plutella xylostella TaxID=51655 RepID=UPI0020327405|nr:protein KRI1 homolog [Plutella xylostella]
MPQNKLFDEDSEDENVTFDAKGEYAKRYDAWRQKEELHKLEQKYGDKALNSDGEVSSDSEDEEPQEMSPEMEEQFLKTLALLKTKDPRIYDPQFKFFEEAEENRKLEEAKAENKSKPKKEVNSLAAAFADSDDDDDENNDGGIFKVEKKAPPTQREGKKEDKIRAYLKGEAEVVDSKVEAELAPLRALWADPALNEGEKFLRDYILNKRYEGDNSSAVGEAAGKLRDDADLEADEEIVEEQGRFERAYNFRFEEPDQDYLKRYPRTMNYIRPKDDKRSKKRVEVKTRKEEEKARKMEEIARMKALKLKEIQEKIARIKEVTGNDELAFKDSDIEGDFDPEAHDRRMRALFDEQYYGHADEEKPTFPDLDEELEIENWDEYEPEHEAVTQAEEAPHCEDEDFNMDADYDPKKNRTTLLEEIQETLGKKRRNRKKKTKLAALLEAATDKPKFVPSAADKTYAEYMEEYYKMDCEDVIAGELPTRFKYREVVPNDFGLSIEEILLADDKELNRWASLKKTVKYRPENVEKSEVKTYSQRAADPKLKRTLLPSLFKDLPEEPEVVVPVVINKKKNKANVNTDDQTNAEENVANGDDTMEESKELNESIKSDVVGKKKKKKKNKKNANNSNATNTSQVNEVPVHTSNGKNESLPTESLNNDSKLNESAEGKKKRRKKKKKPNQTNLVEKSLNSGSSQNENKRPPKPQFEKDKAKQNQNVKTPSKPSENNKNKLNGNVKPANALTTNKVSQPPNQGKANSLKRKLDSNQSENETKPAKQKKTNKQNQVAQQNGGANKNNKHKMKNKAINKNKGKSDKQDNPLSKLSDERLKAYGLNPKKYRSFLKYKKF